MSQMDEIRARVEGRTPGPWELAGGNEWLSSLGIDVGSEDSSSQPTLRLADAELIAAAPKLLAALEAVEALHRKVPVYMTEAGDCKHGGDCESVEIDGESMCPDETEGYTCSHCAEMNTDEYPDYPCPTLTAIKEALQ